MRRSALKYRDCTVASYRSLRGESRRGRVCVTASSQAQVSCNLKGACAILPLIFREDIHARKASSVVQEGGLRLSQVPSIVCPRKVDRGVAHSLPPVRLSRHLNGSIGRRTHGGRNDPTVDRFAVSRISFRNCSISTAARIDWPLTCTYTGSTS